MKRFFKENMYSVLFLILAGLVLILWSRVMLTECVRYACLEHTKTRADRVRALEYFGWQVDETSETEETVYVPQEFDAVWNRYNEIQKMSGFDLLAYRGQGVKRYTYRACSFPGMEPEEVFLNLLVAEGRVIGGDCMTVALDGVMLPLDIRGIIHR